MLRYKVMVVDDSAFMRKIIADLITENSEFDVIGTAKNGLEAIEKAKEWKPDVITLDVEMPVMNGLDALKAIMGTEPIPVIMLSSLTDDGTMETIKALEFGAVDFVRKPSGPISLDLYKIKELLLEKLRIAVKAKLVKQQAGQSGQPLKPSDPERKKRSIRTGASPLLSPGEPPIDKIVAVGTSTGGPKALQSLLSAIPGDFPAPVLVVQHMPPNFTKSLADRLDSICELHVVEGENNMAILPGTVYIAPGGQHMKAQKMASGGFRIQLTKEEPRSGHRPSVDMLFESLVPYKDIQRYAVIMTGMGADGAKGIKKLRDSGATATIAESEETCIVYGMPRAAVELKAIDFLLKLHDIPNKLVGLLQADRNRNRL